MTQAQNNSPPNVPEHTLLRQIGQGAYGEVWLARSALGAYRAVKVIHRSQFDHERPYERELRAIREVEPFTRQHEGLVDILQVGERDDYFYYVMELADELHGERELDPETYQPRTLTMELYERERLPPETTCSLGVTIAKALAFLHENNLVHRDVKLSNIIYVKGRAKLADVGLVTRSDASFSLVGTYGYIPREGPGRPPADIYALGKVLYEAATGKDRADFPEIDVMDPALKGLNRVFLKACADEPDDRYASAALMADELERLIQNDQVVENVSPPRRSYKTGALAASLLLILALIFYSKDDKGNNTTSSGSSLDGDKGTVATDFANKGLVAYYPFNGNAEDESGNGNDGEVKGATLAKDRHGVEGKAYRFDGVKDFINCGDAMGLALKDRISISAWIATTDKQAYILSRWTDFHGRGQTYGLGLQEGKPLLYLNGPVKNMDDFTLTGNEADIVDDQWHHIVVTWDKNGGDNNTKIFVDGKLAAQKTSPESSLTTPQWPVQIGGGVGLRREWFFRGTIDDARIYNRALSLEEVKALYDREKPKPLEWDFTHHYDNVMDPAADTYLHSAVNAVKYAENAGNACYWAPEAPGKEASVTYKYSFQRKTEQAWLNAGLSSYNFGPGRSGKGSLWASKDGENWIQIIDAPTPTGKNAPYHVREHLPQAVLGTRELWLQARIQTEGLNILSQFSRYGLRDFSGEVYSLRVNLETENEPALTKGLVAHYPLDGNAEDESGNGNAGEVKGAKPCEDRFGRPSKAYRFDGLDDVIRVPDSDMLDLGTNSTSEWTVSIWFKGDIQREGWLLGKATQSGSPYTDYGVLASRFHQYGFHGFLWGTGLSAAVGGSDLTDWMAVKSDAAPDQWHHLLAVYGGSDSEGPGKKVYIDGKLAAEAASGTRKNKANGGPLSIGGVGSQGPNWKGEIDDVRIYNRLLSAEEVAALYELEKTKSADTKYNEEAIRVITVGGSSTRTGKVNGGPEKSLFFDPHDIAVDLKGNAYISEHWNHGVRRITAGNYIASEVAGNLMHATGLGIDPVGNLYVTRFYNGDILRITPDGQGKVVQSGFTKPCGVCVDSNGNMWVANTYASQIIRINPAGDRAIWNGMRAHHIALGPNGDLYVACQTDQTIRRIGAKDSPEEAVEIVAGKPDQTGHIDGPVEKARFTDISGVTVSASGTVYVGDNSAIRRISPEGQVSTLAGDPMAWRILEESADKESFGAIAGLAIDAKGSLWMAIRDKTVRLVLNAERGLQK